MLTNITSIQNDQYNQQQTEQNKEKFQQINPTNIQFKHKWTFWEGYKEERNSHQAQHNFLENNYQIIEFNDLRQLQVIWCTKLNKITNFFTFEGKIIRVELPKFNRIIESISLFKQSIFPGWEDQQNIEGGDLQIVFEEIQSKQQVDNIYKDIVCNIVADDYPFINETNGIRFADKTWAKGPTKIRLEIWFNFNESSPIYSQKIEQIKAFFQNIITRNYEKINFKWSNHSVKK